MAINNAINQEQICVATYLSGDTAAVTGDGTWYTLICDTKLIDNSFAYDSGTGIFTAQVTGNYHISYSIGYKAIAGGANTFAAAILQGAIYYAYTTWPTINQLANFQGVNGWVNANATIILPLTIGQTITVVVSGVGGAKNDSIAGVSGAYRPSSFSAYLINY